MAVVRGFEFPDDLYYLVEQDTWIRLGLDGLAMVGITSLGCKLSGEVLAFMPKPLGMTIERDRAVGLVEISKTIRSARTPVGGVLVAANEALNDKPALINEDPYGAGWLVKLKPTNWAEDIKLLVTGNDIPKAMESYMDLNLVE